MITAVRRLSTPLLGFFPQRVQLLCQVCVCFFLFCFFLFGIGTRKTYSVFFADVVQLKAPGMGPDSAEHLEILEEFGTSAAPAPLRGTSRTCAQRRQLEGRERLTGVFVRWLVAAAGQSVIPTEWESKSVEYISTR